MCKCWYIDVYFDIYGILVCLWVWLWNNIQERHVN